VTLQVVRDWVMTFNAHGPARLIGGKAPVTPRSLNDALLAALVAVVESGPTPAIYGVVRWRIVDLCQWLHDAFQAIPELADHDCSVVSELWYARGLAGGARETKTLIPGRAQRNLVRACPSRR